MILMSFRWRLTVRLAIALGAVVIVTCAVLSLDKARYGHFLSDNAAAPWIALAAIVIGITMLRAERRIR